MIQVDLKFNVNSLILSMLLPVFFLACSKQSVSDPITTVPPVPGDPAQYGTPFTGVPDSKDIVMYEVNIRTYSPTTFKTVQARLDSIKALGVNVIWLMPTYPIGILKGVGSPYSVMNYTAVNTDFGTLADLQNFVARAHALGIAVIMDWEANDTSWDNPWISNTSWYLQDASGNIIMPPGTTYADVAALNFNNTDMRAAMIKAMKYWIYAANIDGYRCDFADNVPVDFWAQALDTLSNIKTHKLIYLAEGTHGNEITAGFQLGYAFSYYSTLKGLFNGASTPGALFSTNSSEIASLPAPGIKLRYTTNHDDASSDGSTLTVYKSQQGALAAFVLAAYMGGVPLIYGSQEVGYPGSINFFVNVPVDYTANPDVVAAYKQIIAFRAAHEGVKTGVLTAYSDVNVVAFEKVSGADDVLILVNARNSAETFALPAGLQNTNWTNGLTNTPLTLTTQYVLPPYGYLVLSK
jgi:glycosidase